MGTAREVQKIGVLGIGDDQIETGGLQINNDEPGLYLRGDDAILLMGLLIRVQNKENLSATDHFNMGRIVGLVVNQLVMDDSPMTEDDVKRAEEIWKELGGR